MILQQLVVYAYDMSIREKLFMRVVRIVLLLIHGVTGLGALAGGYACIVDPIAPLGAPVSMLEGSPFDTFLIPGLVLFGLFGVGNLFGLYILAKRYRWYGYVGGILGAAMVVWIIVQVAIISTVAFLHVLFFLIGLCQGVLSYAFLAAGHLFPTGQVERVCARILGKKEALR